MLRFSFTTLQAAAHKLVEQTTAQRVSTLQKAVMHFVPAPGQDGGVNEANACEMAHRPQISRCR
ncbi:MAG: hypothetical protein R3E79_58290 [Caldilineaceae bacterium]